MIYLKFLEGQGLGNQLWNYVALRSISSKLGFGYEIINPENFKGKNFLDIKYSEKYDKQILAQFIQIKSVINIFKEKLYYDKVLQTFASDFDNDFKNSIKYSNKRFIPI